MNGMRFAGRSVAVTGAASGIGQAMARLFLAEGALVTAGDLDPEGVPAGCEPVRVDVSDAAAVEHFVDVARARAGRLDVLCNNAGIGSTADAVSCTVEEWDRVFAVNARGVFLGTRHALPHMLSQGSGVIVNTASVAGLVGLRDRAAYCASKGAVIAFTRQVALQYAGTGVRCCCVCPGTVDSPWVGRLVAEAQDPEEQRRRLIARQPMGRLGTPDEIARAVLYLASDDASFMTGEALVIDGGLTTGPGP
jgi:NAD(P)-dependent dehydrogenase (short-subunit alcohol dehydrogenase family)